jgi:hypothetical protein
MGRSLHISSTRKKSGCSVGSPPEICTTSGCFSLRTTQSSMAAICESAKFGAVLAAARVADGAGQIAGVADLDQREATVLLVVRAEAAVVGAAPFYRRVVDHGLLGRLDEDLAGAAVVVHIVGDQHALVAMLRAALQHPDFVVFEDDLRVDAAVAGGADGDGDVVEEIGAKFISHYFFLLELIPGCHQIARTTISASVTKHKKHCQTIKLRSHMGSS